MKNIKFLVILIMTVISLVACNKDYVVVEDEHEHHAMTNYEILIMKPDSSMKMIDSNMHIHVNFTETNGNIIHHISVKIYEKDNPTNIIYDMPTDKHIMEAGGKYEYHDDFILSAMNGVTAHTDYMLEAKVWGHDIGTHEKTMSTEFHVHQM